MIVGQRRRHTKHCSRFRTTTTPAVFSFAPRCVSLVSTSLRYVSDSGLTRALNCTSAPTMTSILTGGRRIEGSELPVRKVSFQTGPVHPVDDLLIECGDESHEVTFAVACLATPSFVQSHDQTVKLVASLLAEVQKFGADTHHVAVADHVHYRTSSAMATFRHGLPPTFVRGQTGSARRRSTHLHRVLDHGIRTALHR